MFLMGSFASWIFKMNPKVPFHQARQLEMQKCEAPAGRYVEHKKKKKTFINERPMSQQAGEAALGRASTQAGRRRQ